MQTYQNVSTVRKVVNDVSFYKKNNHSIKTQQLLPKQEANFRFVP